MKESILTFGEFGSGKSWAILTTAMHHPDAKFWVLDMDGSLSAQKEALFGNGLPNVQIFACLDWPAVEKALEFILPRGGVARVMPEDWFSVDGLERWWDLSQKQFIEEMYGQARSEHLRAKRKMLEEASSQSKTLSVFEGWLDWPVIKSMHNDPLNEIAQRRPCNLLMTTKARELQPTDAVEQRTTFQYYGLRPEGEKGNPYRFDVFILLEALKKRIGSEEKTEFVLTTLRDRWSGGSVRRYPIERDFWTTYQKLRKGPLKPPGLEVK